MNILFWLVVAGFGATVIWLVWYIRRKAQERRLAEAARAAAFMTSIAAGPGPAAGNAASAATSPAPTPAQLPSAPASDIAQQKLLFESAHKAGEAGEPALSIELYSRLLARYPATTFAGLVRDAMEAQKKKLLRER